MNPTTPQSVGDACILYAEDEEHDIFFFRRALRLSGSPCILSAVPDGEKVIEYLAGDGAFADRSQYPLPVLILLDINMPKKSGLEALQWIRQQPDFKTLPVLMFTSSTREEDMNSARQLGADEYLLKPSDPLELTEIIRKFHGRWLPHLFNSPEHRSFNYQQS